MGNKSLARARDARDDELYTQREDIEAELYHYKEHFRGKVVYCNCDDPKESEFWQFFVRVFADWGMKRLIATHYDQDEQNYSYKLTVEPDANGQFSMFVEPTVTPIESNGDFRSGPCIALLEEADIVCTNPPFSLYREYVTQLVEHNKQFLIIGPFSGVKYKETFPLIRENKMWIGYTHPKKFQAPDGAVGDNVRIEGGKTYKVFGNVQWYTNLDIPKRHESVDLRGNYYYGNEAAYPSYTNFDGIDVANIASIPCDYYGNMGVPISFVDQLNPEQFEIVGLGEGDLAKEIGVTRNHEGRTKLEYMLPDGSFKRPFARIVIRRRTNA